MDGMRFLWIVFCFLLSFWRGLPSAAFFTVLADYFLLFTENYRAGLFWFLLVQTAYLQNLKGKAVPLFVLALLPTGMFFPVPFLGFCYGILFFLHIREAIKKVPPSVCGRLYLLGLLLFVCCDIFVAWGYFHTPKSRLVWLFYGPSQLLLALTAGRKRTVIPIP